MALWRAGVALAAALPATSGWAQTADPPPPANPPPAADRQPEPGQDDIVVTAPAEQSSIDRQTYIVRDTAEARSATTLDILSRVPSVEVQANGTLRLVGAGTATILVDGRRVSGDPATFLRNLQGAQVARIEVMTNPGAQFPAQGTGGIINIITRRNFLRGAGGSVTATASRFGNYDLRAAPTWGRGNWTLSGNLGFSDGEQRSSFERERFTLLPAGPALESSESGRDRGHYRTYSGNGVVIYRPSEKQTISLTGNAARGNFTSRRTSELIAAALPGGAADQLTQNRFRFATNDLAIDYRGESSRPGESLTASAKWGRVAYGTDISFSTDPAAAPASLFQQSFDFSEETGTLKTDYARPLGGRRRLSFGAQLLYTRDVSSQAQSGAFAFGGGFTGSSRVAGSWIEHAGYVTFQFALAGFTILPGIRLEGREYDLSGATTATPLHTTHAFPSLHLERRLTPWLTSDASYSRRVTYPSIAQLDPALIFSDATTANAGNPAVRPQLTDSFEAKLHAAIVHHNVDLTLFRRTTHDIWSNRSDLNADNVLVSRVFNFGTQNLTGGEVAARGPLARGLRYIVSANVSNQGLDPNATGTGLSRNSALYSGSAQLEYKDGTDGRRGADRVNLTLRYFGAYDSGFTRSSPWATAAATWSHALTDRLSGVLTISELRLSPPRESVSRNDTTLSRDLSRQTSPRVSLSLTWSLRPPGGAH